LSLPSRYWKKKLVKGKTDVRGGRGEIHGLGLGEKEMQGEN